MADSKSNTMELNSILDEARSRKNGSAISAKAPAKKTAAPSRQSAPAKRSAAQRSLHDDFVFIDDDGRAVDPRQTSAKRPAAAQKQQPKKKKKTGLIITLVIVGVLLIAGGAGLTMYLTSGSGTGPQSTFSDNVYINGKSMKDLTMDQAKEVMKGVEDELANGIKVDVKAGDKTYNYTKKDFKYSFDTEKVLAEAKAAVAHESERRACSANKIYVRDAMPGVVDCKRLRAFDFHDPRARALAAVEAHVVFRRNARVVCEYEIIAFGQSHAVCADDIVRDIVAVPAGPRLCHAAGV